MSSAFLDGAEIVFVAMGYLTSTIRGQVRAWRTEGKPVGVLSIRSYRPFPQREVIRALKEAKIIVVWDRAYSYGCGGPLANDVRSSLYESDSCPAVLSAIGGLGGAPVGPTELNQALEWAEAVHGARPRQREVWFGVKPYRVERKSNGQ